MFYKCTLEDFTYLFINKNCISTIHKKPEGIMVVFTVEPKKGPEVVKCLSIRNENDIEI